MKINNNKGKIIMNKITKAGLTALLFSLVSVSA